MLRCVPDARSWRRSRLVTGLLAALLGVLLVAPTTASASTVTGPVTDLQSFVGYNSATLAWTIPQPRTTRYHGVTIWRQEGNVGGATPVLVATLGSAVTSYVDRGLTMPPSGVWLYTVYTRDAVSGPIDAQTTGGYVTSAMSGRVTDAQGNGLGGVTVSVGPNAWSTSQATTAADGTWLVDGQGSTPEQACFDPRAAVGGASTTGYQPECYDNVPSVPVYGPQGRTVPMTIGSVTAGVNAVLDPAGAVTGVVRDRRGHLLQGAGVQIARSDGAGNATATTGADGSYRFNGLPPGDWSVCGYQPHGSPDIAPASPYGYLNTCADGGGAAQLVPVTAGVVSTTTITMADGGVVTGQLLDPDGTPVVGVSPQLGGTYSPQARITPTDANGRYRITGLAAGNVTVCFPGTSSAGSGAGFDPGAAPRCWKAADPSAPTPVAVTLGKVVSGVSVRQYRNSAVSGRVVDPTGAPIGQVWVVLDGQISAATGTDGSYQLGVTPGDHTVCFDASQAVGASKSGYADQCWNAQPRFGGTPTPVHAVRGGTVSGVDATLALGAGLKVTVVDAHGTPLQGVSIEAGNSNGVTGKGGTVAFTRIAQAGPTSVGVDNTWNAVPRAPNGYVAVSKPFTPRPGMQSVRLVLPQYGAIAGTVTGPDGQTLAGVPLDIVGSSYVPSWDTAADGTYTAPHIAPGTYTVCASDWVGEGSDQHHATACWGGATDPAAATPVTVGDGATVSGIDLQLR